MGARWVTRVGGGRRERGLDAFGVAAVVGLCLVRAALAVFAGKGGVG